MPTELSAPRRVTSDNLTVFPSSVANNPVIPILGRESVDEEMDQFDLQKTSGRSGTMGLASALFSDLSENKKKVVSFGIVSALREIGFKHLAEIVEKGTGLIFLPGGINAKVDFAEKTYDSRDKYIFQDDIRRACSQIFQKNNQQIKWVEVSGSIELGKEVSAETDLCVHVAASGEVKLSSFLRYRRLELYESPCGVIEKGTTFYNALQVPATAGLANKMPVGSEFEITCEGHAILNPKLSASLDLYQTSLADLSLDSSMTILNDMEGDISILVQKLPRAHQVLVKIARVDGFSSSAQAKFSTKSKTNPQVLEQIKNVLAAWIDKIFGKLRWFDWIASAFDYRVSANLENAAKEYSHEVKRYVFDLSNPYAQVAYNDIFSKFSTKKADELVLKKEKGVRSQSGGEVENSHEYYGDVKIGDTKIWLYQSLQNEREGKLLHHPEELLLFRESKFSKKYFNWFAGEKTINWEAVVLQDQALGKKQNYYHLTFKNHDRITGKQEITDFLNFSKALGINIVDPEFREHVDVENLSHVFTNRDDTNTAVDIYFTDKGIHKIKEATRNQLLSAYLRTQVEMDSALKQMPFLKKDEKEALSISEHLNSYLLMQRYHALKSKGFFTRWWHRHEMRQLEKSYLDKTGQQLNEDFKVFNEAEKFAQKMMSLNKQFDQNHDEKLFSVIGNLMGFNYMKTIAAMSFIAGEAETLIHGLSMSAGGVSLCGKDEGEIIHPEREVITALASLA